MLSLTDDLIPLREVAPLLPRRNGRKPHFSTLWRWATRGVRGVRLETVCVGNSLCTTRAALEEFLAAVTRARGLGGEPPAAQRTPGQRGRATARAAQRVEDAGI